MRDGKLLTELRQGNNVLHFYYDASSRPAMVDFNGVKYTYVHNLQGDIVAVVDNSGNIVVKYGYDAWGKPISTIGTLVDTLGKLNPFRYRGDVYDEETGLYNLLNRCYNPDTARFLNADTAISLDYALFYTNMYAYCINSSIMYIDDTGLWPKWLETTAKVVSGALVVGTAIAVAVCTAPVAVAVATVGFDEFDLGPDNYVYTDRYI